jgi:Uma2 family endonuclease
MPISEKTYRQVALEDSDSNCELYCGQLRLQPGKTAEQNDLMLELAFVLHGQLDRSEFRVRSNSGRVRRSPKNYYVPDVFVVPTALEQAQRGTRALECYNEPLPLVVEIWSISTGEYDVETKLVEYQRRGDLEIWRIHPYERTLTTWRRQLDGSYTETLITDGTVEPIELPGVKVDPDALFE